MRPLHETFGPSLPRLSATSYLETSPPSPDYNCVAWAAGITDAWWWPSPGRFWPPGVPREETLAAFVAAFATLGYTPCPDSASEPGIEKVALYLQDQIPTHAARQLPSGAWSSKLGMHVDIEHTTLDVIAGGIYGNPALILGRPIHRPPDAAAEVNAAPDQAK